MSTNVKGIQLKLRMPAQDDHRKISARKQQHPKVIIALSILFDEHHRQFSHHWAANTLCRQPSEGKND